MLRKFSTMMLTAALLTGSVAATAAFAQTSPAPAPAVQQKIKVQLNGKEFPFPQEIVTENGVAYVNASTLAIALGGSAAWDSTTKSLLVAKDNKYALRMYENKNFAYKNGKETSVANPPRPVTGAVLVPLVFIAQELGATVEYDAKTLTYKLSIPINS
ncbi:copper amine oxidase N-terminal domain-containing protein [Brevibacillus sp. HB1.3]|uniref:copper amine oxidase N-terminal domain-containing protein n=1 Tax=Brevibacillus TaxID=55080 RepID=UPI00115B07CF|nr:MULTISPECIES: copper amine oxidase N-terminal domain-containing protein [Bacillales]NQF16401.1 copper amine oxidase N-terminal domain-containing protein [Brevibacillus sp. HB1.3]TQR32135.1 copper amine oxidase N-terminal domain-containing protein [Lysinibacillus sp. SDF0063]